MNIQIQELIFEINNLFNKLKNMLNDPNVSKLEISNLIAKINDLLDRLSFLSPDSLLSIITWKKELETILQNNKYKFIEMPKIIVTPTKKDKKPSEDPDVLEPIM